MPSERDFPPGAISSINGLLEFAGAPVWHASRTFRSISKWTFTGIIGVTKHKKLFASETLKSRLYNWLEVQEDWTPRPQRHSLVDCNVIPNGYNDWYLFHREEDARAFVAATPAVSLQHSPGGAHE